MANPKSGIPATGFSGLSVGGGRVRPDWNAGGSSALSTTLSSVYSAGSPLMHLSTKTFTVSAQTVPPQGAILSLTYPGAVIGDTLIANLNSAVSTPVNVLAFCAADNTVTVNLSAATALTQTIVASVLRVTRLSFASGF